MKRKAPVKPDPDTSEYYRLNTKAIDDLINANAENSPEVSEEELRKAGGAKKSKIPAWFKILFLKFWFPAAVCFFFLWGLGAYVNDMLDLLVVTAIALGFATDILTNNILRFFARRDGENDKWMMYPKRRFISLPLNVVHSGIVLTLIITFYNAVNRLLISLTGAASNSVPLGVEPVLFGLLYLGFDTILIKCKHLLFSIVNDAKVKTRR